MDGKAAVQAALDVANTTPVKASLSPESLICLRLHCLVLFYLLILLPFITTCLPCLHLYDPLYCAETSAPTFLRASPNQFLE